MNRILFSSSLKDRKSFYTKTHPPLKVVGRTARQIGSNACWYKYENGVLQNGLGGTAVKKLWDPITGEFPGGAIVPGVNDIRRDRLVSMSINGSTSTPTGCAFRRIRIHSSRLFAILCSSKRNPFSTDNGCRERFECIGRTIYKCSERHRGQGLLSPARRLVLHTGDRNVLPLGSHDGTRL